MGHYAKNLEVHVVDQCNLDCVACSHESPFMPRRMEEPGRLRRALLALWPHYSAPLVKLLGGEPMLHPNLNEIIGVIREVTGARLRLVTNGTLLYKRRGVLRGIDEIHISSYPGIVLPTHEHLKAVAREIAGPVTVQRFDAFRWHRSAQPNPDHLTRRIFRTCQLYQDWECHTLRDGRFYACSPSATWGSAEDGVDLSASPDTIARELDRVLKRTQPLTTCTSCLGSVGTLLPHHQGWRRGGEHLETATLDNAFLAELEDNPDSWNGCYDYKYIVLPSGDIVEE
jgi:GTP 3',8-cyclase